LFSAEKTGEVMRETIGPAEEGVHEGALSGHTGAEREKLIQAHVDEATLELRNEIKDETRRSCIRRAPKRTLPDCLSLFNKDDLRELSAHCGLEIPAKERKDTYVKALTETMADSEFTDMVFRSFPPHDLEVICELADAGGQIHFPDHDVSPIVPYVLFPKPFVMTFHHENEFIVVMPEEFRDLFSRGKNELLERSALRNDVNLLADAFTEVYGVVPLGVFVDTFRKNREQKFDEKTLLECLIETELSSMANYQVWEYDDEFYIVHYALDLDDGEEIDEIDDGEYDDVDEEIDDEEIDVLEYNDGDDDEDSYYTDVEFMEYILTRLEEIPMKPLEYEELIKYADPGYVYDLPAMAKLREFLDANIPFGRDDYFFTDKILVELLEMFRFDVSPAEVVEFLVKSGLEFDLDKMNAMLAFVMDAANHVPRWTNSGWSAMELSKKRHEPTKPKKIGRNEPCPCGSGKKYKNCCGKQGVGSS
jgi:hypothetical protein